MTSSVPGRQKRGPCDRPSKHSELTGSTGKHFRPGHCENAVRFPPFPNGASLSPKDQGGRKRRALSHETLRRLRAFLPAAVGTGQAVRPRFPRHAPACSGASPSLVLRSTSPAMLCCCCLAFISRTKSSAVRRCLLMESPSWEVRSDGKVILEYCSSLNECLPAVVADNKASGLLFDRPGRREAASGQNRFRFLTKIKLPN